MRNLTALGQLILASFIIAGVIGFFLAIAYNHRDLPANIRNSISYR